MQETDKENTNLKLGQNWLEGSLLHPVPSGCTVSPMTTDQAGDLKSQLITRLDRFPADAVQVTAAEGAIAAATAAADSYGKDDTFVREGLLGKQKANNARIEMIDDERGRLMSQIEGAAKQLDADIENFGKAVSQSGLIVKNPDEEEILLAGYAHLGITPPGGLEVERRAIAERVFIIPANLQEPYNSPLPAVPVHPGDWQEREYKSPTTTFEDDLEMSHKDRPDVAKKIIEGVITLILLIAAGGLYGLSIGRFSDAISRMEMSKIGTLLWTPKILILWAIGAGMLGVASFVAKAYGRARASEENNAKSRAETRFWKNWFRLFAVADVAIATMGIAKAMMTQSDLNIAQGLSGLHWSMYLAAPLGAAGVTLPILLYKLYVGGQEGKAAAEEIEIEVKAEEEISQHRSDFEEAERVRRADYEKALASHEAATAEVQRLRLEDDAANRNRLNTIEELRSAFEAETFRLEQDRELNAAATTDHNAQKVARFLNSEHPRAAIALCALIRHRKEELGRLRDLDSTLAQERLTLMVAVKPTEEEVIRLVESYRTASQRAEEAYRLANKTN